MIAFVFCELDRFVDIVAPATCGADCGLQKVGTSVARFERANPATLAKFTEKAYNANSKPPPFGAKVWMRTAENKNKHEKNKRSGTKTGKTGHTRDRPMRIGPNVRFVADSGDVVLGEIKLRLLLLLLLTLEVLAEPNLHKIWES